MEQIKIKSKPRSEKKEISYWNSCKKNGHLKKDYRALKKNNGSTKESVNMAEDVGDALILSVNSLVESWILDSWGIISLHLAS